MPWNLGADPLILIIISIVFKMLAVKINNAFLDLYPNTTISFTLKNLMYLGGATDIIPGSYSLPFTIPLTDRNKRLLKHPGQIDNTLDFIEDEVAEIWFSGIPLFTGIGHVQEAGDHTAKLFIVLNPFATLKDKKLNAIELGGDRSLGTEIIAADMITHAKDTAITPRNYDYIFFPVRNPCFFDEDNIPPGGVSLYEIQNFYNIFVGAFAESIENRTAMPFVKLSYLLQQLFLEVGYDLHNDFQSDDELGQLCIYNNYSIYEQTDQWATTINLQSHVSDSKATDFLKFIIQNFCLGLFYSPFDKVVKLIPLRDILSKPHQYDWTDKAVDTQNISIERKYPGIFSYKEDKDDKVSFNKENFSYDSGLNDIALTTNVGTLIEDNNISNHGTTIIPIYKFLIMPEIQIFGTIPHNPDHIHPFKDKLMFYRGMEYDTDFELYPFANNDVYDSFGIQQWNYSLLWNSPYGLYEKWWKEWLLFLQHKKEVETTLCLTIRDLLNFNFEDKIRIDNMNYFVKELSVTLTQKGIQPVSAKLVTLS